ncbi:hypothetical protein [Paenibacillus sp. GCM10027626]|uniref:DUF7408 domain-containing protein n=1 Tax=Paenibacillus sp. GCM10027626 TaxID=3273411 RepID=UPI00363E415D
MHLRRRGLLGLLSVVLLLPLLWHGNWAKAAEREQGIAVQSSMGHQGWIKEGRWYPLRYTLTNQTDADLQGQLVVTVDTSWGGGTVNYGAKVQLPKGTPIQTEIGLPGIVLNKNNYTVHFYTGENGEGKEVPLLGGSGLASQLITGNMIGVIARDADTLNFMPTLNQRGYNINTIPMTADDLPKDALMLDTLDILVLNDVATDSWEAEKVAAITEWVKKGGLLILSGGAGYEKTASAFSEIAPVEAAGTRTIATATALQKAGGKDKPLKLEQPLTVAETKVKEGSQIIMQEGDVPLAAKRQLGKGTVIFAAFDPSLEPLASWNGSPNLWVKLLQQKLQILQPGFGSGRMGGNSFWELQYIADMFPGITTPKFSVLMFAFAAYLLLVAPLLFFLLKRLDRREWAWWIIPSVAVVSSIAIFFIGASDKSDTMAHSIRTVELTGDGTGIETGAAAVFVPTGGSVTMEFDQPYALMSYRGENGLLGSRGVSEQAASTVYRGERGSKLEWRDVSFWSSRKTYLDRTVVPEAGAIVTTMQGAGANMEIELTNNTAADLTEVYVLWEGTAHRVGDLAKGGHAKLALAAGKPVPGNSYYDYASQVFPYASGGQRDEHERERRLLNAYFNDKLSSSMPANMNTPFVIGYSADNEPWFHVNGKKVKSDRLTMWVQQIAVGLVKGDQISIPEGMAVPVLQTTTMKENESRPDGWLMLSLGELEFEYTLPDVPGAKYDKLTIRAQNFPGGQELRLFIWNEQTSKWDWLSGNGPEWRLKAAPYVSGEDTLRMKYAVTADTRIETTMPQIALEGKVRH